MNRLEALLQRIDRKGYKAYKDIAGSYRGPSYELHIDHVQADPFAGPSLIRMVLPSAAVSIKKEWLAVSWRHTALEDYLARQIANQLRKGAFSRHTGSGKSGLITIDAPGQEILPRTALRVDEKEVDVRLSVGLPADGRSVKGKQAADLLCRTIPDLVQRALQTLDRAKLEGHLQLADQQQAVREFLRENGLTAFVANGSILPRQSGISNLPLKDRNTVAFRSPASMEIAIPVPHREEPIRGMGLAGGITLIVGGGYHGKSTLLKAIERGVYNHISGDGREFVITEHTAVKIRAEDGRRIEKVDISPFIKGLPFGRDTVSFSSEDASGSTSQAANIMEALEAGSRLLLIDEDTSANNFMVRDRKMQQLVHKDKEPITPYVDKVRQLYADYGVSTILVLGGSGDYFEAADRVLMMDAYQAVEVTEEAKAIGRQEGGREREGGESFGSVSERIVLPASFDYSRRGREKVDAKGLVHIQAGNYQIELGFVEQLVDESQTRALAAMLRAMQPLCDGSRTLSELISLVYESIGSLGLDGLSRSHGKHPGNLALPRRQELAAAINRLRSLQVKPSSEA